VRRSDRVAGLRSEAIVGLAVNLGKRFNYEEDDA
jgi:hypothetical protein